MATIPPIYQYFYLYIEPFATLMGAFAAALQPRTYLQLTDASSAPGILGPPVGTLIVLRQLGNLYFCFALVEAIILRLTDDIVVWQGLLLCLLIADFGHLLSVFPLGFRIYYDVTSWNAIDYGNILFVYCGALSRICFLAGVGMLTRPKPRAAKKPRSRVAKEPKTPSPISPSPIENDDEESVARAVTKTPRTSRRSKPKAA